MREADFEVLLRLVEQGWRHELGGEVTLDFRPDGLVCELAAPAAALAA